MIGASNVQPGPRIAGAFMRNVQTRLASPAAGATNTSGTVQLQAVLLDPLKRSGYVSFQLDSNGTFTSPDAQTSPNVAGVGWADVPVAWTSTAILNGRWYYRARSWGVLVGAGPGVTGRYATPIQFTQAGGAGIPRSLYLYVNKAIQTVVPGVGDNARSLYLYVNKALYTGVIRVEARSLYLYVNKAMYSGVLPSGFSRSLYLYLSAKDGEVFPYLNHINPTEQYELGQVDLFGDGFGQYLDATQSATLTVSSTNGGNVADNVRDGTSAEWQSTSGAAAWVRFTWGTAKRIVAVVLEGSIANSWGIPRFKFDDASQQDGTVTVPAGTAATRDTQFPVGARRQVYWLATPKVSTYVEVAIASGGSGTNRGFSEAWVIEEAVPPEAAETSRAVLNLSLPTEQNMGIVAWLNRSPNFYPANGGVAPLPAGTVTVPSGAVSGLVFVEESS